VSSRVVYRFELRILKFAFRYLYCTVSLRTGDPRATT